MKFINMKDETMNIETILHKGQSGERLCAGELRALMLHAIDLLKYIDQETQKSILRAHALLEEQHRRAA